MVNDLEWEKILTQRTHEVVGFSALRFFMEAINVRVLEVTLIGSQPLNLECLHIKNHLPRHTERKHILFTRGHYKSRRAFSFP